MFLTLGGQTINVEGVVLLGVKVILEIIPILTSCRNNPE